MADRPPAGGWMTPLGSPLAKRPGLQTNWPFTGAETRGLGNLAGAARQPEVSEPTATAVKHRLHLD